jgi:hypothetical protein
MNSLVKRSTEASTGSPDIAHAEVQKMTQGSPVAKLQEIIKLKTRNKIRAEFQPLLLCQYL